MRTGTGVVEEVCPNGLAKIQTNRNNLYSPCSDSMCADNVVIDAVNPIGAKKGQYVQFNIPDAGMGVKGIICFGAPVFNYAGHVAGAVCCSVLTIHYTVKELEEKIGPKLLDCAKRISLTMGWSAT